MSEFSGKRAREVTRGCRHHDEFSTGGKINLLSTWTELEILVALRNTRRWLAYKFIIPTTTKITTDHGGGKRNDHP